MTRKEPLPSLAGVSDPSLIGGSVGVLLLKNEVVALLQSMNQDWNVVGPVILIRLPLSGILVPVRPFDGHVVGGYSSTFDLDFVLPYGGFHTCRPIRWIGPKVANWPRLWFFLGRRGFPLIGQDALLSDRDGVMRLAVD